MKTIAFISVLLMTLNLAAEPAAVVVFKHELRWTDETRFPNYFLDPLTHNKINQNIRKAFNDRFGYDEISIPEAVAYKIYQGFGKQKAEMPSGAYGEIPEIGIFSFITRANSGYAMFWKMNIIVKKDKKVIHSKEVSHELEFFNIAGYVEPLRWFSPEEFSRTFNLLVCEALELTPSIDSKIVVGSWDTYEQIIYQASPEVSKTLLKLKGAWKSGGNFAGKLDLAEDSTMEFNFRRNFAWEFGLPSFSEILAKTLTDATGIDFLYDQGSRAQVNCALDLSGEARYGIKLKWYNMETISSKTGESITYISSPVTAEIYGQKDQLGYFVYAFKQIVNSTEETQGKFNPFSGNQIENTLGIENIHQISGELYGLPVNAEYNQGNGIVMVWTGEEFIGGMIVLNSNPDHVTLGNIKLSQGNKRIMSSSTQSISKEKISDDSQAEWYPIFIIPTATQNEKYALIQTLTCLFASMGETP